ncbi:MAG: phytanoyl-CoA dioxygenase family protein [Pseudomonadales bacterium]
MIRVQPALTNKVPATNTAQDEIQETMDQKSWIEPEPVEDGALSDAQITSWREQGFTLIHGLLPDVLLRAAAADARSHFPFPGTVEAQNITNFGSNQRFVFPADSRACNEITLHPNLLAAVSALLGESVSDIRLTQSDLWPKYGRAASAGDYDNHDQRIHCDYPNHSLTHPPTWESPDAVEILIYLSDLEECQGSTAVVPRQGPDDPAYPWPIVQTPGVNGLPYINNRTNAEAYLRTQAPEIGNFREEHLYAREVVARYCFGSILFYRHDTWHRGTPVKDGALRFVHNLTFKKAPCDWINVLHPGWSWSMYRRTQLMEKLIAHATVEQRTVLGFPAPGNEYWTEQTVTAVANRYAAHDIDMEPYWDGLP